MGFTTVLSPLRRIIHPGPLTAIFIIMFCYAAALIDCWLWTWPPGQSMFGKLNLMLLTTWVSIILRNFFRAILGGPGYVPKGWRPRDEGDTQFLQFCNMCQGFKPPRAHHCRICQRCVLKMDHHCPWINNCCGHSNHTNFTLFVFFAPVGCLHALIVYCFTIWYQVFRRSQFLYHNHTMQPVSFSVNAFLLNLLAFGLALGTTVAVGILFYYQAKSIVGNCTGIEQWIVEKAEDRTRAPDEAEEFQYPYDYGRVDNIRQVINWRCTPRGDGYEWPAIAGCDRYALTVEQLRQKQQKRERVAIYTVVRDYTGVWLPVLHGLRTCVRVPCTDEPRIPLQVGDEIVVSRGAKYWLYGDKVLTREQVESGARVRGWFPRHCAVKKRRRRTKARRRSGERGSGDFADVETVSDKKQL